MYVGWNSIDLNETTSSSDVVKSIQPCNFYFENQIKSPAVPYKTLALAMQFFSIEKLCYIDSTQQWAIDEKGKWIKAKRSQEHSKYATRETAIWWLFSWSNPEKRTTFTLPVDVVDFKKQMNPQQLANILLKK